MLTGTMNKDVICDNSTIKKGGKQGAQQQCVDAINTKLGLLKRGGYKFKIENVIPKVATKKYRNAQNT